MKRFTLTETFLEIANSQRLIEEWEKPWKGDEIKYLQQHTQNT